MGGVTQADRDLPLPIPERYTAVEQTAPGKRVEASQKFPGIAVDDLLSLFKSIELLDDGDGNHHVMLIEMVHTGAVVKDDVGVEDKGFPGIPSHNSCSIRKFETDC
jgi:hypothetical protein